MSEKTKKIAEAISADPNFLKLTPKQKSFILEYLKTKNATQSAINAGYRSNTANEIGSQNLVKLSIKSLIEKYSAMEAEETYDEKEDLILRLYGICDKAGELLNFPSAIAAIKQISVMRGFDAPIKAQVEDVTAVALIEELKKTKMIDL